MTKRSTLLTSVLLLAACQTPKNTAKGGNEQPANAERTEAKDENQSSASAMGDLGKLAPLGAMMASKLDEPGPYDALRSSPGFSKDKPHWLSMALRGQVTEMKEISLSLSGGPPPTLEIEPLLRRLDKAAADPQVKGLLLTLDGLEADWSAAEELRAGLERFKGGGERTIACHFNNSANQAYHVATACDRIGVSPHGGVTISGAAATPIHLKGLLDRLGLVADIVHVGDYKGAGEPLMLSEPSKAMRETLGAIVDQFYATQRQGLIDGRKLSDEEATRLIDVAIFTANTAVEAKLIDDVAVFESFREEVLGGAEWTTLKLRESGGGFDLSKLQTFLGLMPPKTPKVPHIALVYALGSIIDGQGEGILGARGQIAGHTLGTAIRRMTADENIAAIVLRVNSGGGSAIASEQITQALIEAKAKKPVIVSMGRVAASGGYYISSNATTIYALPDTLTGSIGVVGGKITVGKGLEKIGIQTYHIGRGARSAVWSLATPWTESDRVAIRAMMEDVYKLFLSRVAEGRGKSTEEIHAIAQGRVWTGIAAKERGLVDKLGGLDEALAEARSLAKIADDVALEIYPPEPTLKDILKSFGPVSAPFGVQAMLAEIEMSAGRPTARVVAETFEMLASLREQRIQTRVVFPVVFE